MRNATAARSALALQEALNTIGWKSALELVRSGQLSEKERNRTSEAKWKHAYHWDNAELSAAMKLSPEVPDAFYEVFAAWAPTPGKLNSYECAYYHLLQLRSIQSIYAHSGISYYPVQLFSYYWSVRQLVQSRQLARVASPLRVCEIRFGSGGATAILLTAASSAHSTVFEVIRRNRWDKGRGERGERERRDYPRAPPTLSHHRCRPQTRSHCPPSTSFHPCLCTRSHSQTSPRRGPAHAITVTRVPTIGMCAPPLSSHSLRGHPATCHCLPPFDGHTTWHVHHHGFARQRAVA